MALPTSPSVVVLEKDSSIYTPNTNSSVVGIVGFADKGPVNKATLITSQTNLINTFGRPNSDIPGQGLEGALEILEATNQVYFVRAATTSALDASTNVLVGACPGILLDPTVGALIGTGNSISFKYSVSDTYGNVTSATTTLVAAQDDTYASTFSKSLNQANKGQPLSFIPTSDGGGYFIGSYAGQNAALHVSSNLTTVAVKAVDVSGGVAGSYLSGVTAYGSTFTTDSDGLRAVFNSLHPGADYNLGVRRDGSTKGISIEIKNTNDVDRVIVNSQGAQAEAFELVLSPSSSQSLEYILNASPTESQEVRSELVAAALYDADSTFDAPNSFIDKIKTGSTFNLSSNNVLTSGTPRFVKLIEGTYGLAGGNSGYSTTEVGTSDDLTALIGTDAAKTGLYALNDDSLNISVGIVPGIASQQVQNALITLAETSKNFVAVVAPPYGLGEPQDAINWMNGRGARTASINNSYAAVYWPWVQTFNYFAGADEWYDPAIFAVRQMVYTDSVAEPWFAPAGYRRGRLTKPTNVEVILNQGDKDALYSANVNPVTSEPLAGITIFGQKTAQRSPSALDRINVRRLMIYIRKTLLVLGKPFQFEPNDEFTWGEIEATLAPFISDLKARRAIIEGDVVCDSSTNTPLRVDRNELWCSVVIKPTKAAETIVFEVNLTNQSAVING